MMVPGCLSPFSILYGRCKVGISFAASINSCVVCVFSNLSDVLASHVNLSSESLSDEEVIVEGFYNRKSKNK